MGTDPCPSISNYEPAIKQYTTNNTIAPSDMFYRQHHNLFFFFVTLRTGRLYRLVLNGQSVAQEEILMDTHERPPPWVWAFARHRHRARL